MDDIAVDAFRRPFSLWVVMLALHLSTQSSSLSPTYTRFVARTLLVLWISSLTMVFARVVSGAIRHFGSRIHNGLQVTSLTENIARMFVFAIGGLIVLNGLGVSVTPILTALGVGGLAVALALQDTLTNLFAGFYIMVANQIRVGDYVKLDTDQEGYVVDISWRSTTLRALPNNLIVVPNAKLAQAIVTNYYLPEKRMSLLIPVSVSYDSDIDLVERVVLEEAVSGAQHVPGLLAEPAPFMRFIPGFGESSLDFTLICQVAEFTDQYLAQHELRKRIFKRFRVEGIEIPFPIRTIIMQGRSGESTRDAAKTEHESQ